MSAFDTFVRNHIAYPILPILFVLLLFYIGKSYIHTLRKRAFAAFIGMLCDRYNKAADQIKRDLFRPLRDVVSEDLKLKNEGRFRMLEIGIGTGANLKYYPKNCQLIALDPNEQMNKALYDNCKKHTHITLEKCITALAEDMNEIEDNSIDTVVCTLVLCSAGDVKKVLQEVKRVLVPGGKFFFLEHVHADDGTFLSKIQSFLTKSKIWPTLFLGCELNRHTGETIEKASFSEVKFKKTEVKVDTVFLLKFIRPHICGIATK